MVNEAGEAVVELERFQEEPLALAELAQRRAAVVPKPVRSPRRLCIVKIWRPDTTLMNDPRAARDWFIFGLKGICYLAASIAKNKSVALTLG